MKALKLRKEKEAEIKRIQRVFHSYCRQKGVIHLPSIFIRYPEDEFSSLLVCQENSCQAFERLLGNCYVCPCHFLLHLCHKRETCYKRQGEMGSTYCFFTGKELSIEGEAKELTFTSFRPFTKTTNFDIKQNILIQKLDKSILTILGKLASSDLRDRYNDIESKRNSSRLLAPIGSKELENISSEIYNLSITILSHCHNRRDTMFLLKNRNAFICCVIRAYMKGFSLKGHTIKEKRLTALDPFPSNTLLRQVFGIELIHYAQCLKCLQSVFEKESFINALKKR